MDSIDAMMQKIPDLSHKFYIRKVNYLPGINVCSRQVTIDEYLGNENTDRKGSVLGRVNVNKIYQCRPRKVYKEGKM